MLKTLNVLKSNSFNNIKKKKYINNFLKKRNNSTAIIFNKRIKKNQNESNNINNSGSSTEKFDTKELYDMNFLQVYNLKRNKKSSDNENDKENENEYNKCMKYYFGKNFFVPKNIEKKYIELIKKNNNIQNDIPILPKEKNLFTQNPLLLEGRELNNYYSYYSTNKNNNNLFYSNKHIDFINKEKMYVEKALKEIQKKRNKKSINFKKSNKLKFLGLDEIDINNPINNEIDSTSENKSNSSKKNEKVLSLILNNKNNKKMNYTFFIREKKKLKNEIQDIKNTIHNTIDLGDIEKQRKKSRISLFIKKYNHKSMEKIFGNRNNIFTASKIGNNLNLNTNYNTLKKGSKSNFFYLTKEKNGKFILKNKLFSLKGYNYLLHDKNKINNINKKIEKIIEKENDFNILKNILLNETNQEKFLEILNNSNIKDISTRDLIYIAEIYKSKFDDRDTNIKNHFLDKTNDFNINTNREIFNLINHFEKKSKSIEKKLNYKKYLKTFQNLDKKILKIKNSFVKNRINTYINEALKE